MSQFFFSRRRFLAAGCSLAASSWFVSSAAAASANIPVPGSGVRLAGTGDNFEDKNWSFAPNEPKSSWNIDKKQRLPGGFSNNGLWVEAAMRGQPDLVKRIETPAGGPPGEGSMLIQSLKSGIPGRPTNKAQQDDFLHNVMDKTGGRMLISRLPNMYCRVYVPAFTQWEKRDGNSFGFRAGVRATHKKKKEEEDELDYEEYWPGFFIALQQGGKAVNTAYLAVRSDSYGRDMRGPDMKEKTWYTLGMSFTADGAVHYFFREGVENLRAQDRIASHFPYGFKAKFFETFFFNTVCFDNGRTWSTPWVVDDCYLHTAGGINQAKLPALFR